MYRFCKTFHLSPAQYYETDISDIGVLLNIDYEVKKKRQKDREMEENKHSLKQHG